MALMISKSVKIYDIYFFNVTVQKLESYNLPYLWRWSVDLQQYPVILEKCSCAQTGTDLKLLVVEQPKDRYSPDVTMDVYLDYLL